MAERRPLSRVARVRPSRDGRREASSGRVPPAAAPSDGRRGAGAGVASGLRPCRRSSAEGAQARREDSGGRASRRAAYRTAPRLARPRAGCAHAHPALARLSPGRHRLQRLHARSSRASGRRAATTSRSSARSRRPEAYDLGGAATARPDVGGLLPVFVLDRYEGYEVRRVPDCTREELDRWVEANAAAVRERLPADLVFANHVLLGGPVGAASGAPFAVKAHGSELEYAMRGQPDLAAWGAEALAGARATFVGSAHIRDVLGRCAGRSPRVHEVPPGVDIDLWRPEERGAALAALAGRGATRRAEPGQRGGAAARRRQRRAARALPRRRPADGRLLRQADREEGRPRAARGAPAASTPASWSSASARSAPRSSRSPRPPPAGALHRPARAPAPRPPARPRRRVRGPVRVPGGLRDGRRRGGRGRVPARSSPATRGSRRSRPGSRRPFRRRCASSRFATGDVGRPARAAPRAARAGRLRPRATPRDGTRGRGRALELDRDRAPPAGVGQVTLCHLAA